MTTYLIDSYILRYDLDNNRPWVIVQYQEGEQAKNINWFPPKEDAVYLSQMLRNESPVYLTKNLAGRKWLTTGAEPVGDEES